jgi:hypothetical protein
MAPKPSFPAALLRTYTSILGRSTSQVQFHASRLLGVKLQSQSQNAWTRHFEGVTRGIERMSGGGRLQPIPIQSQTGFGQRRWHSTDFQKSKAYAFEDVCDLSCDILLLHMMLTSHATRSLPSSKHRPTHASSLMSVSPTSLKRIPSPQPSTSQLLRTLMLSF